MVLVGVLLWGVSDLVWLPRPPTYRIIADTSVQVVHPRASHTQNN